MEHLSNPGFLLCITHVTPEASSHPGCTLYSEMQLGEAFIHFRSISKVLLCAHSALGKDALPEQDRYGPVSEIKKVGCQQKRTLCQEEFSVEG